MKKTFFFAVFFFLICGLWAQEGKKSLYSYPEAYVNLNVNSQQELQFLAQRFSIDKVEKTEDVFQVRLWLGPHDYDAFLSMGIQYSLYQPQTKYGELTMANTYEQMASWDRYPTYQVYCDMMDTFQTRYPALCRVDTILSATVNNHKILACYVGSNVDGSEQRPEFFYTSTIHGDEQTGFVMMLHLIDYLLNNYTTDAQVQNILDNVDLYVCPVENPDGMYANNDNTMGGWSWGGSGSTRSNANGIDLNRSYPLVGNATKDYELEVQAMMNFASQHHFVMSANLHGGAEVYNFPWDTWTASQNPHADIDWWWLVGRAFADTCHAHSESGYFMEEYNGVTPGGDWYVITGSRQDYMNYYQHCREVTLEVSVDKSPSASELPQFWTNLKNSFLNYIEECMYGFNGTVTDSITGEPLEAEVFIQNHDINYSEVYSHLPEGKYYRPIKSGTYFVTFSAEGYVSKTIQVTTTDGLAQQIDVQLVPTETTVKELSSQHLRVYPDPMKDVMHICADGRWQNAEAVMFDATGRQVLNFKLLGENTTVNVSKLAKGMYFMQMRNITTDEIKMITLVKD